MGNWWLIGHVKITDRYKKLYLLKDDAEGLPSKFRRKLVPKIWYFMVNAGAVFFLPFLGIYWRGELGYSTQQIGLLQALRPWTSAISGNLLTPLADAWDIHYFMLILTYAGTIISRGLITIGWSFGLMMFLALLMESSVQPMGILVDATVVAGSTKASDGTYGRARLWASVGWGVFAPIAGLIISKFGIHTSFMIFAIIYSTAAIPTFLIPAGLLGKKYEKLRKHSAGSKNNDGKSREDASNNSHSSDSSAGSSVENNTSVKGDAHEQRKGTQAAVPVEIHAGAVVVAAAADVTTNTSAAPGLTADTVSRRTSRASSNHHSGHHVIAVEVDARSRQSTQPDVTLEIVANEQPSAPPESPPTVAIVQLASETPKEPPKLATEKSLAGGEQEIKVVTDIPAPAATAADEKIWPGLKRLFSDVYVLTFMVLAFLMGVGNGFIGYLFLLLTDLGGKGTLLGACLAVNCIGEVPFLYYSGAIIKKLGVKASINIAMAAYVLRVGCYALLPQYPTLWIVLAVEILQGITFGLAYSAGTVHCRRIAPKHLRSTVQGIFSGLYTGFGSGVGGLAGGFIYDAYGGQVMYIVATGVLFVGWIAVNFTNVVHGMRKGVKGGVKGVKKVSKVIKTGVRESIARISPGWTDSPRENKSTAAVARQLAPPPDV